MVTYKEKYDQILHKPCVVESIQIRLKACQFHSKKCLATKIRFTPWLCKILTLINSTNQESILIKTKFLHSYANSYY